MTIKSHSWLQGLILGIAASVFLVGLRDAVFGYFLLPVVLGAGVIGIAVAVTRRAAAPPLHTTDAFRSASITDVINVSHIRVSGVGGACLMVLAATMALQFQRIAITLELGLVGGVALAFILFRHHRHQHERELIDAGPGGRVVFHKTA